MKAAITAALAVMISTAVPVSAQEDLVCMDASEMDAALIDWHSESPVREQENRVVWASGVGGSAPK